MQGYLVSLLDKTHKDHCNRTLAMSNPTFFNKQDDIDLNMVIALQSSTCLALNKMTLGLRFMEKQACKRQQSSKRFKQWHSRATSNNAEVPIARWSSILESTPDHIFRRKCRMTKEAFKELCAYIHSKVGDKFVLEANCSNFQASGEVRIIIGLQIMAGASYLDMLGLTGYGYGSSQTIHNMFHTCFLGQCHL